MNEIKKCSLSGIGFTFEKEAYKRLSDYLESLKAVYKENSDCDEILADIEARIAELILSAQSNSECVVALPLVENIIAQLGTPEDISGEESPKQEETARIPRRLYRDVENSKLGGVCAGIAKYFGVDAVWIRLTIFSPLILCFMSGIPFMWWCGSLGGNLFGIFLFTYIILWFAIPAAKSARQKLEMEGQRVSAQNIAERQGATQEEKAKSSVATAVTALGRVAVVALKILLGLMLFPIVAFIFALLILMVGLAVGFSEFNFANFGNLGNLPEVVTEFGTPMVILGMLLVLIPAVYIGYLVITLLINKTPRWWVLLVAVVLWLLVLIGSIFSGISYAERLSRNFFHSDLEHMVETGGETDLSRQIMESLDAAPDAEQQAEIERLIDDPNAKSID